MLRSVSSVSSWALSASHKPSFVSCVRVLGLRRGHPPAPSGALHHVSLRMFWILWFVLEGSRCRSRDVRTFVGFLTLRPINPPSPGASLLYLSCARQLSSLRSVLLPLASRLKPPPPPFPGLFGYKSRWGAALCYLHNRARRASQGACVPVQSSGFPPRVAVSRNRDLALRRPWTSRLLLPLAFRVPTGRRTAVVALVVVFVSRGRSRVSAPSSGF